MFKHLDWIKSTAGIFNAEFYSTNGSGAYHPVARTQQLEEQLALDHPGQFWRRRAYGPAVL